VHIPENGYFQAQFGPMNFKLMIFSGTSFWFLLTFNREVITEGIGQLR
jgi:hypothetical protein